MTAVQKPRKWTLEEFFAWHEQQEERYELIGGFPVLKRASVPVVLAGNTAPTMMTGASRRHNEVSAELLANFRNQLKNKPCRAYANDAAVRTAAEQLRYPDLVVDCGTALDSGFVFEHPKLVAEILSPSTKSFDLAGKITEYWQIDSIDYILIIDPDLQRAQLHTRRVNEPTMLHMYGEPDDMIDLGELGISIRLGDLFSGLPPATGQ